MISLPVAALFGLALVLTLLFPAALLLVLAVKKKIGLLPLGLGFASFLACQTVPIRTFSPCLSWGMCLG